MLYMKSILVILVCMILAPNAFAWNTPYWSNPGYYGPSGDMDRPGSSFQVGIRIEKLMDERGYVLKIYLSGISHEAIETQVVQNTILIRSNQANVTRHSGDYGVRSFSHAFSVNRRVRLPYDADTSRLVRDDAQGLIRIIIPRRVWNR